MVTPYRILSLDGGGIRGVLTAKLLERLEARCPGFLAGVDLFAGTSTGGILALALANGLIPRDCYTLYELKGREVFYDPPADVLDFNGILGAKYTNRNLRSELEARFGRATLGDLPKRVLISSFDLDNGSGHAKPVRTWKPKFYHNYSPGDPDWNERVVDVALRTSAAPSFFPMVDGFIDGGVAANNPSMCALAQAVDGATGRQHLGDVLLLSVSTGRNPNFLTECDADWGLAQWAPRLVEIVFGEASSGVPDYQCSRMLGPRYRRLDPVMPRPISLDDVNEIPALKALADETDIGPTAAWLEAVGWAQGGGEER